jgi:hypothetical protein
LLIKHLIAISAMLLVLQTRWGASPIPLKIFYIDIFNMSNRLNLLKNRAL